MNKSHNVIGDVRKVVADCRKLGILIDAGLLLNPVIDMPEYIRRIPDLLAESGLYVPTFVAFESSIPGTPNFRRWPRGASRPCCSARCCATPPATPWSPAEARDVEESTNAYRPRAPKSAGPARDYESSGTICRGSSLAAICPRR